MERDRKDIQDWVNEARREMLEIAKVKSYEMMNKDISKCEEQVKQKILIQVHRMLYE